MKKMHHIQNRLLNSLIKVFSGISFTNEKLVDINRITKNMTETVNDISDKVRNIEKGTESTAASTEEGDSIITGT